MLVVIFCIQPDHPFEIAFSVENLDAAITLSATQMFFCDVEKICV
jgi:hypothetical protein